MKSKPLARLVQALPEAGPDLVEAAQHAETPHDVEHVVRRIVVGWGTEEVVSAALRALEGDPNRSAG